MDGSSAGASLGNMRTSEACSVLAFASGRSHDIFISIDSKSSMKQQTVHLCGTEISFANGEEQELYCCLNKSWARKPYVSKEGCQVESEYVFSTCADSQEGVARNGVEIWKNIARVHAVFIFAWIS